MLMQDHQPPLEPESVPSSHILQWIRSMQRCDGRHHTNCSDTCAFLGLCAGADVAAPSGRLMRLRCLVWPRMPFQLQQYCRYTKGYVPPDCP